MNLTLGVVLAILAPALACTQVRRSAADAEESLGVDDASSQLLSLRGGVRVPYNSHPSGELRHHLTAHLVWFFKTSLQFPHTPENKK